NPRARKRPCVRKQVSLQRQALSGRALAKRRLKFRPNCAAAPVWNLDPVRRSERRSRGGKRLLSSFRRAVLKKKSGFGHLRWYGALLGTITLTSLRSPARGSVDASPSRTSCSSSKSTARAHRLHLVRPPRHQVSRQADLHISRARQLRPCPVSQPKRRLFPVKSLR